MRNKWDTLANIADLTYLKIYFWCCSQNEHSCNNVASINAGVATVSVRLWEQNVVGDNQTKLAT